MPISEKMRALPAVGVTLLRAFCKLLAAAALLFFTYFIWDWLNDSFEEWVAPIYNNWGIKYPYAGAGRFLPRQYGCSVGRRGCVASSDVVRQTKAQNMS